MSDEEIEGSSGSNFCSIRLAPSRHKSWDEMEDHETCLIYDAQLNPLHGLYSGRY